MMSRGNRLRMVERSVYRLKRGYGQPLRIIHQDSESYDLTTGKTTVVKSVVQIKRAIVLTATSEKQFIYDIGYLKANSNFTYGGFFTDTTRKVIIDKKDLPSAFNITATESFYIVFNGGRYEIKQVNDEHYALFLVIEKMSGAPVYDVHVATIVDTLDFDEYVSSTPGTQVIYQPIVDDFEISDSFGDSTASEAAAIITERLGFNETVTVDPGGTITYNDASQTTGSTTQPVREITDFLQFDENVEVSGE